MYLHHPNLFLNLYTTEDLPCNSSGLDNAFVHENFRSFHNNTIAIITYNQRKKVIY